MRVIPLMRGVIGLTKQARVFPSTYLVSPPCRARPEAGRAEPRETVIGYGFEGSGILASVEWDFD